LHGRKDDNKRFLALRKMQKEIAAIKATPRASNLVDGRRNGPFS
jgi:hypothetical protein